MANGKKTFYIEINGIQESVSAVDSLNKQLDALEKRIEKLSSKTVNVKTSGGGGDSGLDAEEKLQRQIINQEDKIIAAKKEEYQILLQQKQEFKEINELQKQNVAQARLEENAYANTMQGMKAKLADIKTIIHNTDLGDTQTINKLTTEANELTNKLKEMEQAYGTFGRNVGNYANGVAEGMQKVVIKVGETERTFTSAKEASRTLNNELKTMAINGQQNTEEYNDLNNAVKQLNSTLKDVEKSSVAMDTLLDTMQGIVAVASTAKGLSALFGLDDSAIEQTIQKLVALQNVLQGIEVIRKQMQTQEGIGMLLSRGNKAVDNLVKSIVGVGTASKGATIAVKALSTALKGIGIGLVVAAVSVLITKVSDWIEKSKEAKKEAEELRNEENKLNASLQVQRVQLQNTLATLERFNGTQKEEERIVKELNSKYGSVLGTYKTIAQWKDVLKQKTEAYIQSLKYEAEMQAAIKKLEDAYIKQREAEKYEPTFWEKLIEGSAAAKTRVKAAADQAVKEAEQVVDDVAKKIDEHSKNNKINLYSPQAEKETKKKIKDDSKKIEEAVRQAENSINDLKIKLMEDGLRKELAKLDEANRKELEAIRKNGQRREELERLQLQNYEKERRKLIDKYREDTSEIISDTATMKIQTNIEKIDNSLDKLGRRMNVTFNKPVGTMDKFQEKLEKLGYTVEDYFSIIGAETSKTNIFNYMVEGDDSTIKKGLKKASEKMFAEFVLENENLRKKILDYYKDDNKIGIFELKDDPEKLREAYDKVFSELIQLTKDYGGSLDILSFLDKDEDTPDERGKKLASSLQYRTEITRGAFKDMLKLEQDFYRQRGELQKQALDEEEDKVVTAINKRIDEEEKSLAALKANATAADEETIRATEERVKALYENLIATCQEYNEKRKRIEVNTNKDIAASDNKLFDQRLKDYNDYLSKISKEMGQLPTKNKMGFTDLKGLKSVIGEITETTGLMRQYIQTDIDQVNDDFRNGLITEEDKNRIIANLKDVIDAVDAVDKETDEKLRDAKNRRKQEINEVIQIIGQAATQVIQSIGEINQAAFEKELEAIEKQTEAYEKQLDKQKELTEKYKDDVDSIEDELANARGDRRQHLIDQLNAQMQAQRESLALEKKIEKEKEALEKKKEKLEYDNKVRQWKQNMLTAAMNAALAISSAAVNAYPIPAIPMIAAATAIGAAQLAAVAANKPRKFADGGLLNGRSHSQGGIPVGNTGIEVEGQEYVINKHTTMQNLDALSFINSKRRKLTLDDFIDFYSKNSNVSRNVTSMRAKFADGGELPTLRTDISLNSRLVDTMEKYADRPAVVQVVDIINRTDEVKQVQVLAGLE